jgi:hypothetical protein
VSNLRWETGRPSDFCLRSRLREIYEVKGLTEREGIGSLRDARVSSKVKHKKCSWFGSSNLHNFLFADSRTIGSVQLCSIERHGPTSELQPSATPRLQMISCLLFRGETGRPDGDILMHSDRTVVPVFRSNKNPFTLMLIERESTLFITRQ